MSRLTLSTLAIFVSVLGTACAHHRDVRPSADGIHRVVLKAEDKDGLYRDAMSQAQDYCKQSQKSPLIVSEGSQYTGSMKEESYNTGKKMSKAAQVAGGAVWALGGKNESNAGGVVGLGGGVADGYLGEGYTYEMKFKCQ